MKKAVVLLLAVMMLMCLSGCGCEHEWEAATCFAPKTCKLCEKTEGKPLEHTPGEWTVVTEPVGGRVGEKAQLCSSCGTALTTEEYILEAAHDEQGFTLNVDQFNSRLNNILKTIRPEFSSEVGENKAGELSVYVMWNGAALTTVMPQTADEEGLSEHDAYPQRIQMLFVVNTTQQTTGENPIPVFDLQFETVQAMIMACDPTMTAEDAQAFIDHCLEREEPYEFENIGTLEYYSYLFTLGQTMFTLAISPVD